MRTRSATGETKELEVLHSKEHTLLRIYDGAGVAYIHVDTVWLAQAMEREVTRRELGKPNAGKDVERGKARPVRQP